nr:MAG TPA: hypothetical protein [Caudoviricetes sp.]
MKNNENRYKNEVNANDEPGKRERRVLHKQLKQTVENSW